VGLGNQGLADVFAMMKVAFESPEARKINRLIHENMYYAAVEASMELARKRKKFVQEYKRLVKLGSNNPGELTEEDKKRMQELKEQYFIIDEELKPQAGQQVLLHVNGFGATPLMELYLVYELAAQYWQQRGVQIVRSLVGNYTTSINNRMCGNYKRGSRKISGKWW
jgi:dihydroxyacetone kinase